jgi:hypothetical protein
MKRRYLALIACPAPTREHPKAVRLYGHIRVIATSKSEAITLVEQHLQKRRPLGFSEHEIRKPNPKRTPWIPGLKVFQVMESCAVDPTNNIGVIFDEDDDE